MRETEKVAIARVVIRSKEQLVALRPIGDVLEMATMIFADEVAPPDRLDELADASEVKTTKRELDIAKQLVDSLAGDFEPEKYRDSYRAEVLAMIERKAEGKQIAVQPEAEDLAAPTPDLMSALKASLDAVRERAGEDAAGKKAQGAGEEGRGESVRRQGFGEETAQKKAAAARHRQAVGAARRTSKQDGGEVAPAAQLSATAPNATSTPQPSRADDAPSGPGAVARRGS